MDHFNIKVNKLVIEHYVIKSQIKEHFIKYFSIREGKNINNVEIYDFDIENKITIKLSY